MCLWFGGCFLVKKEACVWKMNGSCYLSYQHCPLVALSKRRLANRADPRDNACCALVWLCLTFFRHCMSTALLFSYEGTIWNDMAHGKGVYTTPLDLCT